MANQIDNDAKVIAGDDYGFGYPAICRLSDTVMLAAHINESDELEIHKSIDDGVNWTLKKTLSNATGSFNLIPMTSTKAGLVMQSTNDRFWGYVSTDAGETWTLRVSVGVGASASDKAILLYDSGLGRLHILWEKTADGKIYGKYSDTDGVSWSDWGSSLSSRANIYDGDIHPINNYVYFINIDTSNFHHLDWFTSLGVYVSVFTLHSSWPKYDLHIAIDSQGNRYVVYVQNTSGIEYLYVDRNEQGPVGRTQLFSPGGTNIIVKGSSSIGIDEDDNVFVYYTKTSDEKTYYRKYDAGTATWEAEVELITVANNRINCEKHVLALSNKLHFVYYQAP